MVVVDSTKCQSDRVMKKKEEKNKRKGKRDEINKYVKYDGCEHGDYTNKSTLHDFAWAFFCFVVGFLLFSSLPLLRLFFVIFFYVSSYFASFDSGCIIISSISYVC